jgi:hypothetical protein
VIQNCVLKDQKYGEYIKKLKSKVKNLETSRHPISSTRSGINTLDREINQSIGIKTVMSQKDFNMDQILSTIENMR